MKQLIIQVILLGVSIFGLVMMYLYAYYQDQDRKNRKKNDR
jgi:mannose/fructose/N-acetylgalactosamine-specific phosphotransferase system component IIC